jgi:hypothetical protein
VSNSNKGNSDKGWRASDGNEGNKGSGKGNGDNVGDGDGDKAGGQ